MQGSALFMLSETITRQSRQSFKDKYINRWLVLRLLPITGPRFFLWGDRTISACELYQTLFSMGAYTESDKALRRREVWPCKTSMRGWRPRAWFLEIALVCALVYVSVCLSVCPPLRALIMSGMIWCDVGHVWLVKQVSWLFPAFNYFIWHLLSIKWMGVAILTYHVVNAYQWKLRWRGPNYKRTTGKTEDFIYKSELANA